MIVPFTSFLLFLKIKQYIVIRISKMKPIIRKKLINIELKVRRYLLLWLYIVKCVDCKLGDFLVDEK